MKKDTLITALIITIIYLVIAFLAFDIYFSHWGLFGRVMFLFLSVSVVSFYHSVFKDNILY
jgi:hypothetical protein